jgi:hypothetical protein
MDSGQQGITSKQIGSNISTSVGEHGSGQHKLQHSDNCHWHGRWQHLHSC